MKTSLDKMQAVEACLLGQASSEQRLLFEANMLLDPMLREDVHWQRQTYRIIREYGRERLRSELEQVHQTLFTASQHRKFRNKILAFFRT